VHSNDIGVHANEKRVQAIAIRAHSDEKSACSNGEGVHSNAKRVRSFIKRLCSFLKRAHENGHFQTAFERGINENNLICNELSENGQKTPLLSAVRPAPQPALRLVTPTAMRLD
jgi:hypothetical protein